MDLKYILSCLETNSLEFVDLDFDRMCRTCLSHDSIEFKNVFDSMKGADGRVLAINEVVHSITGMLVTPGDGLPNKICRSCVKQFHTTFHFVSQVKNIDKAFQSYLRIIRPQDAATEDATKTIQSLQTGESVVKIAFPEEKPIHAPPNKVDYVPDAPMFVNVVQDADIIYEMDMTVEMEESSIKHTEEAKSAETSDEEEPSLLLEDTDEEEAVVNMKSASLLASPNRVQKVTPTIRPTRGRRSQLTTPEEVAEATDSYADERSMGDSSSSDEDDDNMNIKLRISESPKKSSPSKKQNKPLCSRQKPTKSTAKKSSSPKKSPSAASLKCPLCAKVYQFKQSLMRHVKAEHGTGEHKKSCSYCNKEFHRMDDLKRHIRIHTNERPYACTICQKCFKQNSELNEHLRSHDKTITYLCKECPKAFRTRMGLYQHMKKGHEGKKQPAKLKVKSKSK